MKGDKLNGWIFIMPAVIIIGIFCIFASVFAVYMSFNKVNMFTGTYTFVGFENYARLFSDPKVGIAFKNALSFAVVVVPIQTFLAMLMANVLNSKIKFKKGLRIVYFLPTLTSSSALTLIFMFMFSVTGPINGLLTSVGVITEPINFLNDSAFALKVIMCMNIWSTVPVFMTIYLAALADIPKSVYEAADIDGAGAIKQFFKITIPQLRNVTSYVVLVGIIGTLQMFDQAFIFSNGSGGPENSTLTPALLVYNNAFGTMNTMGYASSIAISLSLMIFMAAMVSNKLTKANKGVDE
ncbi:sugar ABC transporter permease [Mollicutes bacterium LVI A0039]|nr:sugar ABC transporter permease [Mollicutes bacterium LVI A0039]